MGFHRLGSAEAVRREARRSQRIWRSRDAWTSRRFRHRGRAGTVQRWFRPGQVVLDGARLDVGTTIVEVHGQAQLRGFDIRALFARASVDQAGQASRALRLPNGAPIAETMQGGYLQAGYNVLSQFNTPLALTPYVRHERVDTQHRVPAGFVRDLSRDGVLKTLGVELKRFRRGAQDRLPVGRERSRDRPQPVQREPRVRLLAMKSFIKSKSQVHIPNGRGRGWVSGFGFWVLGFGLWALEFGIWGFRRRPGAQP